MLMQGGRARGESSPGLPNEMDSNTEIKNTTKSFEQMRRLDESFVPGPLDVICARGNRALQHPGNKRFRAIIQSRLQEYSNTTTKLEKSFIVSEVVRYVRQSSPEGGFVKELAGVWYEVGDHLAREKVGQR